MSDSLSLSSVFVSFSAVATLVSFLWWNGYIMIPERPWTMHSTPTVPPGRTLYPILLPPLCGSRPWSFDGAVPSCPILRRAVRVRTQRYPGTRCMLPPSPPWVPSSGARAGPARRILTEPKREEGGPFRRRSIGRSVIPPNTVVPETPHAGSFQTLY